MATPTNQFTTPSILTMLIAYVLSLLVVTSVVGADVRTPCGTRGGGPPLQRARDASMKHCFLSRSTIWAFDDAMLPEYKTGTNAVINRVTADGLYKRADESTVTFLCKGLVIMTSFIEELDHADNSSFVFDVETMKQRFVTARNSLNTSLYTMVTKCPLLANAPLQLEEVDANTTVTLTTESNSDLMTFFGVVQKGMQKLRVRRFIGPHKNREYPGCLDGSILCISGTDNEDEDEWE